MDPRFFHEVIVCYDVRANRSRQKLFEALKDLGLVPVQRSVMWGMLNRAEKGAVLRLFREHLDTDTDRAFLLEGDLREAVGKYGFGHSQEELVPPGDAYSV
ncbi:MAG: CRISPR-associated endonuclease Cas2 [Thiohalorhabdus sp.]|uniref:CRISPR-associated endonuclease Cas2 n=1 Tax=Thiohalorhabdus sp. TaxID=3094134 RepID=UPI00397FB0B1